MSASASVSPHKVVSQEMTPKGRNEGPRGNLSDWVRPHDRYDVPGHTDAIGQFVAAESCCHDA